MKIICINDRIDKSKIDYLSDEFCEFDDYDLSFLIKKEIEKVVYYYSIGSYEGAGNLIAIKDGKYYIHDCGHCSCNTATSEFYLNKPFNSLDDILNNCSDEAKKDYLPLIEYLKQEEEI